MLCFQQTHEVGAWHMTPSYKRTQLQTLCLFIASVMMSFKFITRYISAVVYMVSASAGAGLVARGVAKTHLR